jgi:glycosyltransferase involved in cell wall biosynthesis
MRKKILIISEKVMPYRCALYREISKNGIDLKVLFLDKWGYEKRYDPTMNEKYSWDSSVLKGFRYEFFKNKTIYNITYTGADKTRNEEKLKVFGTILYYIRTYFSIINLNIYSYIKNNKYDIIIIENYSSLTSMLGAVSARASGKKVVFRGEGNLRENTAYSLRILKRIYITFIFRKIFTHFMYSCNSNKKYYLHYGANTNNLIFVPSAVDCGEFYQLCKDEKESKLEHLKNGLGIERESTVLLGVGRLVKRKNWMNVIHAVKELTIHKKSKIHFILVGNGPEYDTIEAYVKKHELNVSLVGFKSQKELNLFYALGDIIIQCSTYDPSPKALNEALCHHLPMIVSDSIGTAGDVCIHNQNGFVYSSNNVQELVQYIDILASDRAKRELFSNNSKIMKTKWSLKTGVDNIYSDLISSREV